MKRKLIVLSLFVALMSLFVVSVGAQNGVTVDVDNVDTDQTSKVLDAGFPDLSLEFTPVNQSGVPIQGLTANDFTFIEDGTPVANLSSFRSFTDTAQGISILLVLDASGSMEDNLVELRNAANSLIDFVDLGTNDEVGILAFSVRQDGSTAELGGRFPILNPEFETSFTADGGLLKNLINRVQIDGSEGTPLYDALYKGARLASEDASNPRRVVILMTDGVDADRQGNVGQGSTVYAQDSVLQEVQRLNVPIFTIGLGDEIDGSFLTRIANATGGTYQQTPSAEQLGEMFTDIATLLKQKYAVSYVSQADSDDSKHTLEILADTKAGEGSTKVEFNAAFPLIPWVSKVMAANPRQDFKPLESFEGLKGRVLIQPTIVAREDLAGVNYYVDDVLVDTIEQTPWEFVWDTGSLTPNENHALTIEPFDDANPANIGSKTFSDLLIEECSIICIFESQTGLPAWIWLVGLGLLLLLLVWFLMSRRGNDPEPMPAYPGMTGTVAGATFVSPPSEPINVPPAPAPKPMSPTVSMDAGAAAGIAGASRPSPKTEVLQRQPATIAFLIDAKTGREFALADGTTVGRSSGNDIILDDASVSQQQAKLRLEGKQFALFDLGSTNGTEVNGEKIARQELKDGDKVTFGRIALVFKQL